MYPLAHTLLQFLLPPAVGSYLMRLSVVRMALPLVPMAFQLFPKWQASNQVLSERRLSLSRPGCCLMLK